VKCDFCNETNEKAFAMISLCVISALGWNRTVKSYRTTHQRNEFQVFQLRGKRSNRNLYLKWDVFPQKCKIFIKIWRQSRIKNYEESGYDFSRALRHRQFWLIKLPYLPLVSVIKFKFYSFCFFYCNYFYFVSYPIITRSISFVDKH